MDLPPTLKLLCDAAFALELTGEITLIITSSFVFNAVLRCSVLHANIKLFLLLKSCSSFSLGCMRSWVLIRLLTQRVYEPNPPFTASIVTTACIHVNNLLSLAYTTERLLATVQVKTYEGRRPFYGIFCVLFVIAFSVFNTVMDVLWHPFKGVYNSTYSVTTVINYYISNAIGVLCIAAIFYLRKYNLRRYKRGLDRGSYVQLSERYQNSENVRVTRQLLPVILLHVLSGFAGSIFLTSTFIWPTNDSNFFKRGALHIVNCFLYLLCQIAVLCCHPILRREAFLTARNLVRLAKCKATTVAPERAIYRLTGGELVTNVEDESRVYFNNLADSWNQHYSSRRRTSA